jgi:ribosome-interacting GTPase 1
MPANASYEYGLAQKKYDEANTSTDKLVALQEMLSTAPNHKGAENLRKDISRKISSLKNKMVKQTANLKKSGYTLNVKKDGDGQVVIVGLTNSGKSTFLKEYTNAKPLIANYPYTTVRPEIGTLNYGGALIQLIEVPSFLSSGELGSQIHSMIRVADLVIFTIRDDDLEELDGIIDLLESKDIFITKKKPKINIVRSKFLGISFVNEQNLVDDKNKVLDLLRDSGYKSHTFILNQKTKIKDILLSINPRACFIPSICVSMPFKSEITNLKSIYRSVPIYLFKDKSKVCTKIFAELDEIIVYTKKPGQKADTHEPLVLDKGSTVLDAAMEIHKTIYKNLKSAKVWGSTKYKGQNVSKKYVLQNQDVVEFMI